VINLSMGAFPGSPDDDYSKAVDRASSLGISVVTSAGNMEFERSVGTPGVAREAITVAAADTRPGTPEDQAIAQFSSKGPVIWGGVSLLKPDVSAPGVAVCAARHGSYLPKGGQLCRDAEHLAISGTSMAAPHVAGAVALLRQAYPSWTPRIIKQALLNTSQDLRRPGITQGAGMIQIRKALNLVTAPPVVEPIISELAQDGGASGDSIRLRTQITGRSLGFYRLQYAAVADHRFPEDMPWKEIAGVSLGGTQTHAVDQLLSLSDGILPNQNIYFRLLADGADGASQAFGFYKNSLIEQILVPTEGQVYATGMSIPFDVIHRADPEQLRDQFREAGSDTWKSLGGPVWKTAGLKPGNYQIKVMAVDSAKGVLDYRITLVTLIAAPVLEVSVKKDREVYSRSSTATLTFSFDAAPEIASLMFAYLPKTNELKATPNFSFIEMPSPFELKIAIPEDLPPGLYEIPVAFGYPFQEFFINKEFTVELRIQ
jgi:hypothetical protein